MKNLIKIREYLNQEEKNARFNYMLLSRCESDLKYFWGYGNKSEKHLYFGSYKIHINKMIEIWRSLPKKPLWLRPIDLINYKNKIKDYKV